MTTDEIVARPAVGVVMNPVVPDALRSRHDAADLLEIVPETMWVDRGVGRADRFSEIAVASAALRTVADGRPLVAHGLGMSIGSAMPLDLEHLDQMAAWLDRHDVAWYSEHLSFFILDHPGGAVGRRHSGIALPLVFDDEALELISGKVTTVQRVSGRRLLLENGVVHAPVPHQPRTEAEFLTELCAATGCGVLLDLHNLYTDCVNHGLDAEVYLDQLDCAQVCEIHVAGGVELLGMHTDSHTGPVEDAVWPMLAGVLERCPALRAVTYEFHESSYPAMGAAGMLAQLDAIRALTRRASEVVGHGAR